MTLCKLLTNLTRDLKVKKLFKLSKKSLNNLCAYNYPKKLK